MRNPFEVAAALDECVKWLSLSQHETRIKPDEATRLVGSVRDVQRAVVIAALASRGTTFQADQISVQPQAGPTEDDLQKAVNAKGSNLMADYDILTKYLKMPAKEAEATIARLKRQKLEDLKLQVMAQNPMITGIAVEDLDSKKKKKGDDEAKEE